MSNILETLRREYELQQRRADMAGSDTPDTPDAVERDADTIIGGTTITIDEGETTQSLGKTQLSSGSAHGLPRGREAFEARQLARTQPMQLIANAIVDQLTGGELAFPSDDEDVDQAEADLQALVRDVLRGPHPGGVDFDDLVAAWVEDLIGVGNAYAEPLGPTSGDLPVVALKTVDPLTVRHDVDESGMPADPPYYQAPVQTVGGTMVAANAVEPEDLDSDELVVMRYPGSHRSDRVYPLSPAMQVKAWLEVLNDSTTHHGRYYSDNELPPGILTAREATQTDIDSIKAELEAAKADPRSAPVVGTDARWVEVGGSAVDLNVIEEQKWFVTLVAAAFGIPPTEIGILGDANRNEGSNQLSIVHKRVTEPLAKTIGQAISRQVLPQFDLYRQLDQPFDVSLRFSDARQERAQEDHLRQLLNAGAITLREYRQRTGGAVDDETEVQIGDTTVDYAAHPKDVVKDLFIAARQEQQAEQEQGGEAGDEEAGDTPGA